MDCRSCEKYINEYLDGELSKREEKKFQKHLSKCQACKIEFDQYLLMNDQLENVEELSPGEGFEARILSQLQPYEAYGVEHTQEAAHTQRAAHTSSKESFNTKEQRDRRKDLILVFGYFITLFVVLSVLRNAGFQNGDWISGIMVTGRVFREVFDGVIFRGALSLLVVYPIRIFHWARINFTQMSMEGRVMYSLVVMNLLLIITFSHILLRKLAKGPGKDKGGSGDEIQHSRT